MIDSSESNEDLRNEIESECGNAGFRRFPSLIAYKIEILDKYANKEVEKYAHNQESHATLQ